MALYDKKILYLDYLENGRKIKNAGFAKVEVRDGSCRILLNVKGTYDTDSLRTEVLLLTDVGEIVTDHFMLSHGTGTYLVQYNPENMADKGITYEECLGVGVRLSENRMVQATWRELIIPTEAVIPGQPEQPQEAVQIPEPEQPQEAVQIPEPEQPQEAVQMPEPEQPQEAVQMPEPEQPQETVQMPEPEQPQEAVQMPEPEQQAPEEKGLHTAETAGGETKKKSPRNAVIYDNKWKQLCQVFETIHPFHDERSYLSVTPKDFIVLTKEFQPMVNNSFLLHGFYNYRHIILGKEENGREERYYIGVPGVYYDREKQVAVMFGFESFESEKEPAENGGFGYYMKRVDI